MSDLPGTGVPVQPAYTDEDVERVVRALFGAMYGEQRCPPLADFPECSPFLSQSRAVLDALAAAGRLVPPGSEVVEEWGARISHDDHPDEPQDSWRGRRGAEKVVAVQAQRRAANPDWRGRAELIRRRVITTPAEVVADQTVPVEDR